MYFFFRLSERKRYQKEKDPVCTSGATPDAFRPKGQELASLKQPALLNGRPSGVLALMRYAGLSSRACRGISHRA